LFLLRLKLDIPVSKPCFKGLGVLLDRLQRLQLLLQLPAAGLLLGLSRDKGKNSS